MSARPTRPELHTYVEPIRPKSPRYTADYSAEYHSNIFLTQHPRKWSKREIRWMRKGMAHALPKVHEYRSKQEAYEDIKRSMEPQGVGSFILLSFFGGIISWIAQKIANYIWENWRGSETNA